MADCFNCQKPLLPDETALYRRLFGKGADRFMCLGCMAEYLNVPQELLEQKIEYFRSIGCTLFEH